MPRKPVNEVSQMRTRESLWGAIRTMATPWTLNDLKKASKCTVYQCREYVNNLEAAGIVAVVDKQINGCGAIKPTKIYELVQDRGVEPPRVRRDGSEVTQGRGREQMWETMRALGSFSAHDIHVFASTDDHGVSKNEAKTYCSLLGRAGYLRRDDDKYTLIKRTGPKPPMIQRTKNVYDPNLGEVVWCGCQGGNDDEE
jgi:hypothetical protein